MIAVKPETEAVQTETPHINEVTLAAMREAEDMISGKTPEKWYKSPDEMISALKEEIDR
jgi:hypothetical protein